MMRAYSVISSFDCKIIMMIYHYLICNVLCANELCLKSRSEDYTDEKIKTMTNIKKFEMTDITMINFGPKEEAFTSEFPCSSVKIPSKLKSLFDTKDINGLIKEQKLMMVKIKSLFLELKDFQTLQRSFEMSQLESFYEEFLDLTLMINKKMIYFFKKELVILNRNMTTVLENINNILVIESVLNDDIEFKSPNLFLVIPLREALKNTAKFYSECEKAYLHREKKRNIITDMVTNLKRNFNMILIYMKNISSKFKTDTFDLTKARMQKVFKLFDESRKASFFSVNKLIKKKIALSQRKLSHLNEVIYNFINPYE
ncbi:hypothetical protein NBO_645g0001 [Nosema bombycis CQ1]|uniref:Uncharacterized protein n=1 Tax=Nosema bombycis (strain CQ1 / CVCC 102059) TaxID=578461 RepID=R0KP19_NOSB1|nr:hypothetical protein NBO_645g0001 [Nosema bombycis CQ1]|eukprot:EOB11912.1 hypothetical protein NBO_645g0001 [Nosema bombycis CQ1]